MTSATNTAAAPQTSTHFDRTLALRTSGREGWFDVELDATWASLRGVHGGYMTALAVRAAEQTAPGRAVRTIATTFLRPADVGAGVLRVETLRAGRSFTTVEVELNQQGRPITNTRITMLAEVEGRGWAEPVLDRPAPRQDCVAFTPPPSVRHFGQAELLLDPSTIPVGDGSPARIAGHVRAPEVRPIDVAWLAVIGDYFPPSPFRRYDPPIGGVSIDYTVHIHEVPTPDVDWLEGVFTARTSAGGIALERGTLALPGGALVAETFHTRWTG